LTTAHQNRPQEREFGDARSPKEGREKISDRSMISRKATIALLFLVSTGLALSAEMTGQVSIQSTATRWKSTASESAFGRALG
jgi:hypothetical protein